MRPLLFILPIYDNLPFDDYLKSATVWPKEIWQLFSNSVHYINFHTRSKLESENTTALYIFRRPVSDLVSVIAVVTFSLGTHIFSHSTCLFYFIQRMLIINIYMINVFDLLCVLLREAVIYCNVSFWTFRKIFS